MKRILLDTHALIWALESPELLSSSAFEKILNIENEVFVSQISFFEIAIKQTLGKITLQLGLAGLFEETRKQSIEILPVNDAHLLVYSQLPLHAEHRDPFDRAIIATAFYEQLEIVTVDEKFKLYPDWVNVTWQEWTFPSFTKTPLWVAPAQESAWRQPENSPCLAQTFSSLRATNPNLSRPC